MSTVERYGTLFPTAVVGSMPRPEFVRQIVLDGGSGDKDADGQRLDAAVAYAASLQSAAGLDIITDGEWRRASYVGVIAQLAHGFELGTSDDGRPWTVIVDKVEPKQPGTVAAEVAALRRVTDRRIKVCLPAPALLGERMWESDRSALAYPTRRAFIEAVTPILRQEAQLCVEAGAHVVQVDDPHLCLLVDEEIRRHYDDAETEVAGGADGEARLSVDMDNEVLAGVGSGAVRAVHLCRRAGARVRGDAAHAGGYDPIISALNQLDTDHLTLEFTSPGAGDVSVLRQLREDIEIGLGCVSVHPGQVDEPETIVRRVEQAMTVIDKERIVLNPDCGFAPGSAARVDLDEVYTKLSNGAAAARLLRE
ncbi:MAG: cobalamin-independent methionine synthase II family protein, partial [Candidatus Latescibacteria bacterium]|nr:cobalamin-independent methionine synthase II family protein [Candidatus Latescibacterota bacterium]